MANSKTPKGGPTTTFWNRIQEILKSRGMTQRDVSRATGISTQAIQGWRNGALPGSDNLQQLAETLGVPVDMLLSEEPAWPSLARFFAETRDITLDERAFLWAQAKYLHVGDPGIDGWADQLRSYRLRMRLIRAESPATER
jgi:transcriptional regulator with XRE-family HTH domain